MKKANLIITLGIALLFAACNQNQNTDAILENENQRHQIMETIAKDPQMMKEMTTMMMDSTNGQMMMGKKGMMQGMMGNQKMMQGMMKENPDMMQNMMDMAQSDTAMRNNMMGMMTQHKEMMQSMMKKMHENGMMSTECMESCMQRMKAMNTEGGMGNPDNSPQNDHSSHH